MFSLQNTYFCLKHSSFVCLRLESFELVSGDGKSVNYFFCLVLLLQRSNIFSLSDSMQRIFKFFEWASQIVTLFIHFSFILSCLNLVPLHQVSFYSPLLLSPLLFVSLLEANVAPVWSIASYLPVMIASFQNKTTNSHQVFRFFPSPSLPLILSTTIWLHHHLLRASWTLSTTDHWSSFLDIMPEWCSRGNVFF